MGSRLKTGSGVAAVFTVLGVMAMALVGGFEGKSNKAYRDIVGVATICHGETRGVKMGDVKSDAECRTMLGDGLVEFETGMRKCLKAPDKIPDKVYLASLSLTWNIGVGAFCKSSIRRLMNAGDLKGACNAIGLYTRAGGKVVKGLVTRRARETKLCLEGL